MWSVWGFASHLGRLELFLSSFYQFHWRACLHSSHMWFSSVSPVSQGFLEIWMNEDFLLPYWIYCTERALTGMEEDKYSFILLNEVWLFWYPPNQVLSVPSGFDFQNKSCVVFFFYYLFFSFLFFYIGIWLQIWHSIALNIFHSSEWMLLWFSFLLLWNLHGWNANHGIS